jgi:hypothetical protein
VALSQLGSSALPEEVSLWNRPIFVPDKNVADPSIAQIRPGTRREGFLRVRIRGKIVDTVDLPDKTPVSSTGLIRRLNPVRHAGEPRSRGDFTEHLIAEFRPLVIIEESRSLGCRDAVILLLPGRDADLEPDLRTVGRQGGRHVQNLFRLDDEAGIASGLPIPLLAQAGVVSALKDMKHAAFTARSSRPAW